MQRILLKCSQLCSSKGVYVRNTAKTNMELYKSRVVRYGPVLLSKLMMLPCHSCTPMPGGSPAVLFCIRGAGWGCLRLRGQCPSLPGEVRVGQKTGGGGQRGALVTALMAGEAGGEGWRRLSVRSTGKGNSSLLSLPSRSHFPASPLPSLDSSTWLSFSGL